MVSNVLLRIGLYLKLMSNWVCCVAGLLVLWEGHRPFHSDTQVGRLKAPKPVYCHNWTGYSPDDQLSKTHG